MSSWTAKINKYCYNNKINKTTTTNKRLLWYNKPWKFCFGSFLNGYVIEAYIVYSRPIKVIQNNFILIPEQ